MARKWFTSEQIEDWSPIHPATASVPISLGPIALRNSGEILNRSSRWLKFLPRNVVKRSFQLFYDVTGRFETPNYHTLEVDCFTEEDERHRSPLKAGGDY